MGTFEVNVGVLSWEISNTGLILLAFSAAVLFMVARRARRRLVEAAPARRSAVTVLHVLAFLAVLIFLFPPRYPVSGSEFAVLVTEEGFVPPDAANVYSLRQDIIASNAEIIPLLSVGQLLAKHPQLRKLAITGHGLSAEQWSALPMDLHVEWLPQPASGLVDLRWSALQESGGAVSVTGQLSWPAEDSLFEVRLVDPAGTTVDQTLLRSGDAFGLMTVPRALGPVTYQLQLRQDEQLLSEDPISVFVRPGRLATLRVLQSAPSFETRQLANWATDRGASMLIQTQISKGRDLLQRINLDESTQPTFVPDVLRETDLMVIDGRRWVSLSDAEKQRILAGVSEGLGLFLNLDAELAEWLDAPEPQSILGVALTSDSDDEPRRVDEPAMIDTMPLPVAPWQINPITAEVLTRDTNGAVLDTWQRYGAGRIGVTRLQERYRWATTGNTASFARYWARILSTVGRAESQPFWLAPELPAVIRSGARASFCTKLIEPGQYSMRFEPINPVAEYTDVLHPITRSQLDPSIACGFVWPNQAGWHRLQLIAEGDVLTDAAFLRVMSDEEAVADRHHRQYVATQQRMSRSSDAKTENQRATLAPLSRWWAWALLLLSLVPLWVERRLFQLA